MNESEALEAARAYPMQDLITRVTEMDFNNFLRIDCACAMELARRMSDIMGLMGPQP